MRHCKFPEELTDKEQEIYNLIVKRGLTLKEIGAELSLARTTVRLHINHICWKKQIFGDSRLLKLAVNYWTNREGANGE